MKHYPKGEEKLSAIHVVPLTRKTLDGKLCLSFRDLFHNLVVNEIKKDDKEGSSNGGMTSYDFIQKVQETTKHAAEGQHRMSRKHKKRIEKQAKKLGMMSSTR